MLKKTVRLTGKFRASCTLIQGQQPFSGILNNTLNSGQREKKHT